MQSTLRGELAPLADGCSDSSNGKANDLDAWGRSRALLGYIEGRRVVDLAEEADVSRGSVNRWLQRYDAQETDGLTRLVNRLAEQARDLCDSAPLREPSHAE